LLNNQFQVSGNEKGQQKLSFFCLISIHAPCGCDVRQCRNFSRTQSGILQNWPCYDRKNIQLFASEEAEHLFHSFMITATDGAIKF